jgi:NADH:ubiquinone oxidoreductase subunit 6 (subunit J)
MNVPLIIIVLLVIGAAAIAMSLRNLIHSALLLIGTWAGIGAFYLWAAAEFVAFAQVLVYVGAVSMVVLFAVLLTRPTARVEPTIADVRRGLIAFVAAGGVAGLLLGAIFSTPLPTASQAPISPSVRDLGVSLMGPHAPALLVLGVILTVALLGAVVIASGGRDLEDGS